MKKILFLFVALIMSVCSAWAVVTPKASNATTKYYYKMHCAATSGHVGHWYINIVEGVLQGGAGATAQSDEGSLLEFVPATAEGQWYLMDVASGKYLESTDNTGSRIVDEPTMYWTTTTQTDGIRLLCNGESGKYLNNNGGLAVRGGTGGCSSWVLEEEQKVVENAFNGHTEALATSENLTSGKFYVISGYGQTGGDTNHFLYDNAGAFATATALTTSEEDSSKFAWRLVKNGEGLWSFQNAFSGKYITFEGNGNNSPVTMGEEEKFYTIHWNADGNIAAFKNSNGQGIDLAYWGTAASTWSDDGSVGGSRRMRIYEAEVVSTVINSYSYTVVITGAANGALVYNETNYANAATIVDLDAPLATADLSGAQVDGYNAYVSINGSVITVLYLPVVPDLSGKEVGSVGDKVTVVESDKWYLLTQTRGGETPAYDKEGVVYRASSNPDLVGRAATDLGQYLVRFVDAPVAGAKYIQFANGKFWGTSEGGNAWIRANEDMAHQYLVYEVAGQNGIGINQTADGTNFGRRIDNNGAGNTVAYWDSGKLAGAGNALWYVYPVELVAPTVKADVTYEIYLDGVKIGQEVKQEIVGKNTAFSIPATTADYVNIDFTPGEITGNMTVQVNSSYKDGALPFKLDGTKYNLALNRQTPVLEIYYVNGETDIFTKASNNASYVAPTYATQDYYKWVIGGDWYNGFTLKNAGEQKYVSYGSASPADNSHATLVENTDGEGSHFELRIKNNTEYYFRLMGTTNAAYISNFGGAGTTYLTNWNSENNYNSSDKGAQFVITEAVELPEPPQFDWTLYQAKLTQLKKYEGHVGTELGQYSMEYKGYTLDSWTFANLVREYQEKLSTRHWETVEEDLDAFNADVANMQNIYDNLQLNMPQKGAVIRIKASDKWIETPTYLSGNNRAAGDRAAFVVEPERDNKDVVWMYDGQFLTCYGNGLTAANNSNFMNIQMYPKTTRIEFQAAQNGTVGKYNIKFAGSRFLYTNKDNYTDAGSGASAEGYNFELESAADYFAIDYGTAGWASLYLPVDVALNPEYGIEAAYIIKSEEDGYLKAEEIRYLPGFTPAIVKVNPEMAQGNNPFGKGCSWSGTSIETALDGSLWKMANSGDNTYVLNLDATGNPIFRHYTGATLGHCKAYYQKPAASSESVLRINFGEENPTAIMDAIMEAEFSGDVYDLTGRRINGVQNGVFIKNGRKVIK